MSNNCIDCDLLECVVKSCHVDCSLDDILSTNEGSMLL